MPRLGMPAGIWRRRRLAPHHTAGYAGRAFLTRPAERFECSGFENLSVICFANATVSLRLGHGAGLTAHRAVIQHRAAASLPFRGGKPLRRGYKNRKATQQRGCLSERKKEGADMKVSALAENGMQRVSSDAAAVLFFLKKRKKRMGAQIGRTASPTPIKALRRSTGLPRQCAHWLAMTRLFGLGRLTIPPSASPTPPFTQGRLSAAAGTGR